MIDTRFSAFKVSIANNQVRWGHIHGLTSKQARENFPSGRQKAEKNEPYDYIWSYALTECVRGSI